jgi:DNA-binding GntR family transcriptional regulator
VAAAGNPVLLEFYESLRDRQVRMGLRAVAGSDDRVRRVVQEHRRIVAAVGAGDPEDARAAVAAHLAWTLEALRPPGAGRPR